MIEKKYQRRDWSKRPLTEEMLIYAVKDTCHLLHLGRILEKELEEKIKNTDLVITTEGRLDSQTLQGKAPFRVAQMDNFFSL